MALVSGTDPRALEALKVFVDNPPEQWGQVVFMYRQAIGQRTQVEANLAALRRQQAEVEKAIAEHARGLDQAMGYERGLHDVVQAALKTEAAKTDAKPPTTNGEGHAPPAEGEIA